jgi:hypothetical protein
MCVLTSFCHNNAEDVGNKYFLLYCYMIPDYLCSGVSLSSGGEVFNLAATQFYPLIAVGPTRGSSITYHLVSGFYNSI